METKLKQASINIILQALHTYEPEDDEEGKGVQWLLDVLSAAETVTIVS